MKIISDERRIIDYLLERRNQVTKFWDVVNHFVSHDAVDSDARSHWLRVFTKLNREGRIRRTRTGFVRIREDYLDPAPKPFALSTR